MTQAAGLISGLVTWRGSCRPTLPVFVYLPPIIIVLEIWPLRRLFDFEYLLSLQPTGHQQTWHVVLWDRYKTGGVGPLTTIIVRSACNSDVVIAVYWTRWEQFNAKYTYSIVHCSQCGLWRTFGVKRLLNCCKWCMRNRFFINSVIYV